MMTDRAPGFEETPKCALLGEELPVMIDTGYCPSCGCELVLDDETYNYEDETRLDWYHCPACNQVYQVDEQDKIYAVAM